MPDAYIMPAPTGSPQRDTANLLAAFQSPKRTILCLVSGVYLLNAELAWPSNKHIVTQLSPGEVVFKADTSHPGAWMFQNLAGPTNLGATGITFDANAKARFAAGNKSGCGLFAFGYKARGAQIRFFRCEFVDVGTNSGRFYSDDLTFSHCVFRTMAGSGMLLSSSRGVDVDHCQFIDYNHQTPTNTDPAIAIHYDPQLPVDRQPCKAISITSSRFYNRVSMGFGIEVVGDYHEAIISGNYFDASWKWGTSISGALSNSIITGNRWDNTSINLRCGLELNGSGNTVSHNIWTADDLGVPFEGGSYINLTGNSRYVCGRNTFAHNTVVIKARGTKSLNVILLSDQFETDISHNRITVDKGGEASINAFLYANGATRDIDVFRNTFQTVGEPGGFGIRSLSGESITMATDFDGATAWNVHGNRFVNLLAEINKAPGDAGWQVEAP